MALGLFIDETDLKRNTILNGNVDVDLFIHYVKLAQIIHLQSILGSSLYLKLTSDIAASTFTGVYATLVTNHVMDMTVHWTMVMYLPFAAYKLSNNGIFKPTSREFVATGGCQTI